MPVSARPRSCPIVLARCDRHHLTGVWHAGKAAIPHLIAGGSGGSIVLTSSAAGLKGYANIAHYVAAKHGMVGLMRTLAQELAPHSIRVNTSTPPR